jgi:hypothetical protein
MVVTDLWHSQTIVVGCCFATRYPHTFLWSLELPLYDNSRDKEKKTILGTFVQGTTAAKITFEDDASSRIDFEWHQLQASL